jgi:hypothetical protein
MAITFEEKSDIGPKVAAVCVIVALLGAAVFFGVKLFQNEPTESFAIPTASVKLDTEVLKDPRIASLELFPEVPPAAISLVRENPFVDQVATTTRENAATVVPGG